MKETSSSQPDRIPPSGKCEGEVLDSVQGYLLLNLRGDAGQEDGWKMKMKKRRWSWWKSQGSQRERSTPACDMVMTMGWNETQTQTSWAKVRCARDESDNSRNKDWLQRLQHYAHAHVFHKYLSRCTHCWVSCCAPCWSCASCRQWCSYRCDRPLILSPQFLHISHREKGSFEVLSLHLQSVTVDRRQL